MAFVRPLANVKESEVIDERDGQRATPCSCLWELYMSLHTSASSFLLRRRLELPCVSWHVGRRCVGRLRVLLIRSLTLLLDAVSSFSSLYHLHTTSHICQNRSIEFKQMSEGQTASPRANAFFPRCITCECVCGLHVCVCVCVCVCVSHTAMLTPPQRPGCSRGIALKAPGLLSSLSSSCSSSPLSCSFILDRRARSGSLSSLRSFFFNRHASFPHLCSSSCRPLTLFYSLPILVLTSTRTLHPDDSSASSYWRVSWLRQQQPLAAVSSS